MMALGLSVALEEGPLRTNICVCIGSEPDSVPTPQGPLKILVLSGGISPGL